jgi:hypothetical protein
MKEWTAQKGSSSTTTGVERAVIPLPPFTKYKKSENTRFKDLGQMPGVFLRIRKEIKYEIYGKKSPDVRIPSIIKAPGMQRERPNDVMHSCGYHMENYGY